MRVWELFEENTQVKRFGNNKGQDSPFSNLGPYNTKRTKEFFDRYMKKAPNGFVNHYLGPSDK